MRKIIGSISKYKFNLLLFFTIKLPVLLNFITTNNNALVATKKQLETRWFINQIHVEKKCYFWALGKYILSIPLKAHKHGFRLTCYYALSGHKD